MREKPTLNTDFLSGPMKVIGEGIIKNPKFTAAVDAYVDQCVKDAFEDKENELLEKEEALAVFPSFEFAGDQVQLREYAKQKYDALPPVIRTALEEEAEARVAQRIAREMGAR